LLASSAQDECKQQQSHISLPSHAAAAGVVPAGVGAGGRSAVSASSSSPSLLDEAMACLIVMAMIFHKTKQQELQSLSHAECRRSTQSKFGTPKKSSRHDACKESAQSAGARRMQEREVSEESRGGEGSSEVKRAEKYVMQKIREARKKEKAENDKKRRAKRALQVKAEQF
jgi:hypothetical protein